MNLRTLLKPLAHLPLGVLYGASSALALLAHRVVRYRLGVVRNNLKAAFPDTTDGERRKVERQFYRNFTDSIVETLKLMHISDAEMRRRMEFVDTEVIDRLFAQGRSIVVYFAHTFCWEWAPSVSLHTQRKPGDGVQFGQVYRPLRSEAFDKLMLDIRGRFNSESYPKEYTLRRLVEARRRGLLTITGFMSDQHPGHGDQGHYTTLLGRPTMMITGTESLARRLDMAAVYWDMEKTSRGHYRITTRLLAEHPAELAEGELTERYTRALETTIRRNPAIWLWSHNRWKHPAKPNAK